MMARHVFYDMRNCLTRVLHWTYCICLAELWLDWIKDEMKIVDSDDESDREKICRLFQRATKDYMCKLLQIVFILLNQGKMNGVCVCIFYCYCWIIGKNWDHHIEASKGLFTVSVFVIDCDVANKWVPLISMVLFTLNYIKHQRKKTQLQMLTVNGVLSV